VRTRAKKENTVVESWVDLRADIDAINRGEARRQGDTWTVNGRTYRVEPGGTVYPLSGPGLHHLDRGAYRALGVYNAFGTTARAEAILDNMNTELSAREAARRLWQEERDR
jgi:hypothetical protein